MCIRDRFLHPNQLRFAAAQVPGVSAVQAVVTRPDGVRDHLLLRVAAPLPVGEGQGEVSHAALAEALKAAVQGVCRVRVDEVMFGDLVTERMTILDKREWK